MLERKLFVDSEYGYFGSGYTRTSSTGGFLLHDMLDLAS